MVRYWCYVCNQSINPIMEVEIKCPNCNDTFVEEIENQETPAPANANANAVDYGAPFGSPIILPLGLRQRHRSNQEEAGVEESNNSQQQRASIIYELFNELQSRLDPESNPNGESGRESRRRHHTILIGPFGQSLLIPGSNGDDNGRSGVSLGDYFVGPGLDELIQRLAENDPTKYGTPPAQKEAVEAMPKVKVCTKSSCSVCLEDFELGDEAREMPCKHMFHGDCILPWLEMHSSCPVCRYQMPAQELKDLNGVGTQERSEGGGANEGVGRRILMSIPWPFNGLFSQNNSENGSS